MMIDKSMKNVNFKIIRNVFLILFVSVVLGVVLLWGVYSLPTGNMKKNIILSEEKIREQDDIDIVLSGRYSDMHDSVDTITHIIMFHEVIASDYGSSFENALLVPSADYWAEDWVEKLIDYCEIEEYGNEEYQTYARYWHGYLVMLKPLFYFFSLQQIYLINAIILCVLVVSVFGLFVKRLGWYSVAYLLFVMTMNPISITQSIQLSAIFYVVHISLLLLMCKKWEIDKTIYIFTFSGIMVAYFDFLTYPLVAVAVPLLTAFILNRDKNLGKTLFLTICNGVAFVVGYVGMWSMKWVIATLFTSENILLDAINSVLFRIGVQENDVSEAFGSAGIIESLYRNILVFLDGYNWIIILVMFLLCAVFLFAKKKTININWIITLVCIVFILSPFLWLIVLNNHASYHPHLEWRTICVAVYSVAIWTISLFDKTMYIK